MGGSATAMEPRGWQKPPQWWFRGSFNHPFKRKSKEKNKKLKKQTARFFYYIHQYHHYKNPKPKTLMVRPLLFPSGLCISLSLKLPHHAPLLQLNFNGWFQ
jgi:hypothetical protein